MCINTTNETLKNKLIISKTAKSEILSKLEEYNQSKPAQEQLSKQFAIYFFHYVAKQVRRIDYDEPKNKDEEAGYARLSSTILKKKHYKYNKYFDFLKAYEFLDTWGKPSAIEKRSTAYSINPKYVLTDYEVLEITDKKVIKTLGKDYQDKKIIADYKCPHLTQYLNSDLSIDYDNALNFVKNEYFSTIINSNTEYEKKKALRKYESRIFSIYCLKEGQIFYSREGIDDRLHSNITNMAKTLRQFLLYKGKPINFTDFRSSQPFFLILFIYWLIKNFGITENQKNSIPNKSNINNKTDIFNYKSTYSHTTTTSTHNSPYMLQKFEKHLSKLQIVNELPDDFKEFLYLVVEQDQDLYQSFGNTLINAKRKKNNPTRIEPLLSFNNGNFKVCTNVKGNNPIFKYFDNIRQVAKFLIFRYLFTNRSTDIAMGFKEFKDRFPFIANFIKSYQILVENSNNNKPIPHLSVLLQNMESELVLDIVTKEINKLYPEIPLFTIHDAIGTTSDNVEKLLDIVKEILKQKLPFQPIIRIEGNNCNQAA